MHTPSHHSVLACLALLAGLSAGCTAPAPPAGPPKPPEVSVAHPVKRVVNDYEVFTGRTEAVASVEVRARVTGYLDKAPFKEGADIKAGDVLFEIDPRTYAAEAERARGALGQAEARYKRLTTDFQRSQGLLARNAIGREEADRIAGDRSEAEAAVATAKAGVAVAELNLSFTKVTAPLDGRVGKRMADPGNLIKADETLLTNIVTLDPMYVSFDIDERTLLRLRRLIREGKMPSARSTEVKVDVGLADEDGYSLSGAIGFIDNHVDPGSGTLRLRASVENPRKLLSPGLFVRVRLPVGPPHEAVLVPEEALGSNQGERFLLAVGEDDVVSERRVKVGPPHDKMRVIESGITPADRVIVTGLQRVRAKQKVTPKEAKSESPAGEPVALSPSQAPPPR